MPLKYKINILEALKEKGYSSYFFRTTEDRRKKLSESTLQKLRKGEQGISWDNIETICRLLDCQPGDIIEYEKDTEESPLK